jgi:hypothetical protein
MAQYLKMTIVQEQAMCILWFFETKSAIKMYRKDPSSDNSIPLWLKQFQETGTVTFCTEEEWED